MEIELLLVPECPHGDVASDLILTALADLGMTTATTVTTTVVTTEQEAAQRGFVGSPSILLNGRDLFPIDSPPALACRMYATADGLRGLPELRDLRRALKIAADPLDSN